MSAKSHTPKLGNIFDGLRVETKSAPLNPDDPAYVPPWEDEKPTKRQKTDRVNGDHKKSANGDAREGRHPTGITPSSSRVDEKIVVRLLRRAGFAVKRHKHLSNGTGTQFSLKGGGVVNVFNTGKSSFQGTLTAAEKNTLKRAFATPLCDPRR